VVEVVRVFLAGGALGVVDASLLHGAAEQRGVDAVFELALLLMVPRLNQQH